MVVHIFSIDHFINMFSIFHIENTPISKVFVNENFICYTKMKAITKLRKSVSAETKPLCTIDYSQLFWQNPSIDTDALP